MRATRAQRQVRTRVVALILAWSLAAVAEPTGYEFSFAGAPGCDDRDAFVQSFEARTQALRLVPTSAPSSIAITIEVRDSHTNAELSIRLEDGRVVERSVEALSCSEAIEAIGFVTALALDPQTARGLREKVVPSRAAAPHPVEPRATPARPRSSSRPLQASLGAFARLGVGATPNAAFGAGLGTELTTELAPGWRASLRMQVSHERPADFVTRAGAAHFEQTLASLDVCPRRLAFGNVEFVPCIQVTAGAFLAEGQATYAPTRTLRGWVDAGPSLLIDVPLGDTFVWSTRGALGFPWTRDAFQFDDVVFHRVGSVVGAVTLGIYFRLP